MNENTTGGSEAFWEIAGTTVNALLISGFEIVLSVAALILFTVATIQLYRKSNIRGSKHILIAMIALIIGSLLYTAYSFIAEDDSIQLIENYFGVYTSACTVLGAYGYWLICKTVINNSKS